MNGATGTPPRSEAWFIISDLHLGDAAPSPGSENRDLAAFIASLSGPGGDSSHARRHLVLLGDTFDLAGSPDPATTLLRVEAAHPQVFAALREAMASGLTVHVVTGNHDLELARPAVWRTLVRLLSGPGSGHPPHLHPWFVHEPGMFYAEHGHQHHPVHRSPTMLELGDPRAAAGIPESPLQAWTSNAEAGRLRRLGAVARSTANTLRAESRTRSPAFGALLAEQAEHEALTPQTVRRLSAISAFQPVRAAMGVLRRSVSRRLSGEQSDMLSAAAGSVSECLSVDGHRVPVVVFGHTHRARLEQLPGRGLYANSGTWSHDLRERRSPGHPGHYPYITVIGEGADVRVSLDRWPHRPLTPTDPSRQGASHAHE